jgi:hypothetical protein
VTPALAARTAPCDAGRTRDLQSYFVQHLPVYNLTLTIPILRQVEENYLVGEYRIYRISLYDSLRRNRSSRCLAQALSRGTLTLTKSFFIESAFKMNPAGERMMGRYLLLWLLGVPIPILVLIWAFGGLH